jgi:2-haloacid dehalogenase
MAQGPKQRPKVAAFDIIGTVFSLEPLRSALTGLGLPAMALDWLYAATLRDSFALAATDGFAPFQAVLGGCLDELLALQGVEAGPDRKQAILGMMAALPPYDDARPAFETLAAAGIRIVALSNGSADATRSLLGKAGLDGFGIEILSVEAIRRAKPRPEVYRYAAEASGVAPSELALVAAHPWDVHGARCAGLVGAYVARGRPYAPVLRPPDIAADTLRAVAERLAALAVDPR